MPCHIVVNNQQTPETIGLSISTTSGSAAPSPSSSTTSSRSSRTRTTSNRHQPYVSRGGRVQHRLNTANIEAQKAHKQHMAELIEQVEEELDVTIEPATKRKFAFFMAPKAGKKSPVHVAFENVPDCTKYPAALAAYRAFRSRSSNANRNPKRRLRPVETTSSPRT